MRNETLYVVAATVIPVYFLALTLQGTFSDKIQAFFEERSQRSLESWQATFGKPKVISLQVLKAYLRTRPYAFVLSLTLILATLAIFLSAVAEAFALLALYNGYAYQFADVTVLSALLVLTIGTALLIAARIYIPMALSGIRIMVLVWRRASVMRSQKGESSEEAPRSNDSQ